MNEDAERAEELGKSLVIQVALNKIKERRFSLLRYMRLDDLDATLVAHRKDKLWGLDSSEHLAVDVMKQLKPLNLNSRSMVSNQSLLQYAIDGNDPARIRVLAKHGADLNSNESVALLPPVMHAIQAEHPDCLDALIECGAAVGALRTTINMHSVDAIQVACMLGQAWAIPRLTSAGLKPDRKTDNGTRCTAAKLAADKPDCISALFASGANLNRTDRFGNAPSHEAARLCSSHGLLTLLELGVSIDVKDGRGRSARDVAYAHGDPIASVIRSWEASQHARTYLAEIDAQARDVQGRSCNSGI